MACPYCLGAAATFLLSVCWFQQDLPNLIYASLPTEYKTWSWFALCFLQEANQLFYSVLSASFIFQLHILFPGSLSRVLQNLAESARSSDARRGNNVRRIIRQIHVVQLLVNLFNVGHRNITYCIKLICISESVVNGYGTIAHGREDMVFLLMASSITFDLVFLYAFVYEKAFAIPDSLERVRRELMVKIQGMGNASLKKVNRRELKAVPLVGLKVGDFHMLERESTPMFVDYVLRNIVNLLVSL